MLHIVDSTVGHCLAQYTLGVLQAGYVESNVGPVAQTELAPELAR